jgi:uncharacterized membrane protein (DUF106 family)
MEPRDIIDRLAAIDDELQELQKRHALAQSGADLAEVNRLQQEIAQLMRVKDQPARRSDGSRAREPALIR